MLRWNGERELSYTVGGNANWCIHYSLKQYKFPKRMKLELPCDPINPLLAMLSQKRKHYVSQKTKNTNSKRYMNLDVHGNYYSSQDMKAN